MVLFQPGDPVMLPQGAFLQINGEPVGDVVGEFKMIPEPAIGIYLSQHSHRKTKLKIYVDGYGTCWVDKTEVQQIKGE